VDESASPPDAAAPDAAALDPVALDPVALDPAEPAPGGQSVPRTRRPFWILVALLVAVVAVAAGGIWYLKFRPAASQDARPSEIGDLVVTGAFVSDRWPVGCGTNAGGPCTLRPPAPGTQVLVVFYSVKPGAGVGNLLNDGPYATSAQGASASVYAVGSTLDAEGRSLDLLVYVVPVGGSGYRLNWAGRPSIELKLSPAPGPAQT